MPRRRKVLSPLQQQLAPTLAIPIGEAGRAGGSAEILGSIAHQFDVQRQINQQKQEANRLASAVGSGQVKASSLTPTQRQSLGMDLAGAPGSGGHSGLLGAIGSVAKFAISPAWWLATTGKHAATELGDIAVSAPQGIYSLVKNLNEANYGNIGGPATGSQFQARENLHKMARAMIEDYKFRYGGELPSTVENIKDPVARLQAEQQYKKSYGGDFFSRLNKQPLSYALDVGTLASLGIGGAARAGGLAARVGRTLDEARAARAGSEVIEPGQTVYHGTSAIFDQPIHKPGTTGIHVSTDPAEANSYASLMVKKWGMKPTKVLDAWQNEDDLSHLYSLQDRLGIPPGTLRGTKNPRDWAETLRNALQQEGYDAVRTSRNNWIVLDPKIIGSPYAQAIQRTVEPSRLSTIGLRLAKLGSTEGRAPISLRAGIDPERIVTPEEQFARQLEQMPETAAEPGKVGLMTERGPDMSKVEQAQTEGIVPQNLPRYYARSHNRRMFQKLILDPLLERAQSGQLGELGTKLSQYYEGRAIKTWGRQRLAAMKIAQQEAGPIRSFNALQQMEHSLGRDALVALHLTLRGVHDDATIAAFQEQVRQALATGDTTKLFPAGRVPQEYLHFMSNLPQSVIDLVKNPSPEMVSAADLYHTVEEQARNYVGGISEEEHLGRVFAPVQKLMGPDAPAITELQQMFSQRPIQPAYASDIPPLDYTFRTRRMFPKEPTLQAPRDKFFQWKSSKEAQTYTPDTIMRGPVQGYLLPSELDAFRTGMFRTDPGVLTNSLKRMYQDVVEKQFNREMLDTMVYKDANGDWVPFKSEDEMLRTMGGAGKNFTLIHPDLAVRYFTAEHNNIEGMISRLQEIEQEGKMSLRQRRLLDALNEEQAANAEDFMTEYLSAVPGHGYAVPKTFYKDLKSLMEANQPITAPVLRHMQILQNKWRTWTLAYMPRWFINTAAGSMLLNLLKGVWHPKYYAMALRHSLTPDGTLLNSNIVPDKVRERLIQNLENAPELPSGVRLGPEVATAESAESGMKPGSFMFRGQQRSIAGGGYRMAQQIEDYFRTASFYHSLDQEAKQALRENAQVIGEYRPLTANIKIGDDFAHQLVSRKDWVDKALDDVNRWSYNYNLLGGVERRYVRAAIPFWGWYRFITKFVWRLPVEYPGRLNILRQLSLVGQEAQNELGQIPPWARGALILNIVGHNKLVQVLSTRGLNPIAQFGNPGSREYGTLGGIVNPGQLSPLIQSALAGVGYNAATGETVSMSPEEPYGHDFWGNLINLTGRGSEATPGQASGGRRFLGTLLRSVPQLRIGEQYLAGGRSVYPESIPFPGLVRPIPVRPESIKSETPLGLLAQYSGLAPRTINLQDYRNLMQSRIPYARAERARRLRKQRKALGPALSG